MKYSYEEYSKLFSHKMLPSDDPDDENLYDVPVAYDVCLLKPNGDFWYMAPRHFRDIEDAKDYITNVLPPDALTQINTVILDVGYPETVNWEETKRTGLWSFDDWE